MDVNRALTGNGLSGLGASVPDHGGTTGLPFPPAIVPEHAFTATQWGMLAFLLSEVAFFGTLITTYVTFMGQDTVGPTPREVLSLPLVLMTTACLLASSGTIHLAEGWLQQGRHGARFGPQQRTEQFHVLLLHCVIGRTVYKINVQPAVVVVVQQGDARTDRLQNELLPGSPHDALPLG